MKFHVVTVSLMPQSVVAVSVMLQPVVVIFFALWAFSIYELNTLWL